jgi:hypothetical protein
MTEQTTALLQEIVEIRRAGEKHLQTVREMMEDTERTDLTQKLSKMPFHLTVARDLCKLSTEMLDRIPETEEKQNP